MAFDRAKQFLPFNALKGYYELVKEREKIKIDPQELGEDDLEQLSNIILKTKKGDMVSIIYYDDGEYKQIKGLVSNVDIILRTITIVKQKISLDSIKRIENEMIKDYPM